MSALADAPSENLLSKMRAAYAKVGSAKLRLDVTRLGRDGEIHHIAGNVAYLKGNRLLAEMVRDKTIPVRLKTDGHMMNAGTGTSLRQQAFSLAAMERVLPVNLETICFWDWQRQLSTDTAGRMYQSTLHVLPNQKWKGKNWLVLEETVPGEAIRYYIDPATYLIRRSYAATSTGQLLIDAYVSDLKLNLPLKNASFAVEALGMDGP